MITTLNSDNRPYSKQCADRIAKLKQQSISFTDELVKQADGIDDQIANGDIPPFMLEDPMLADMTQYTGSGIVKGTNVSSFNNPREKYAEMPQNSTERPVFCANTNGYYMDNNSTISTSPWYNSPPPNYVPQYGGNSQFYGGGYGGYNQYYNWYQNEIMKARHQEAQRQAHIAKLACRVKYRHLSKEEIREQEILIEKAYGVYEENLNDPVDLKASIREKIDRYCRMKIEQEREDLFIRGYTYDENGIREEKRSLVVGIRVNGKYYQTGPENGPDGYRTVEITRHDDDVSNFERRHFDDLYMKNAAIVRNYQEGIKRLESITGKYRDMSYDEFVSTGMTDLMMDLIFKPGAKKAAARLFGARWDKNRFDQMLHDFTGGYNSMSTAFFSSYEDAKFFYAMNIAKTPEELMLDEVLLSRQMADRDRKKAIFTERVNSGNVRVNMAFGARARDFIPRESIPDMAPEELLKSLDGTGVVYDKEAILSSLNEGNDDDETNVTVIENPISICGIKPLKRTITTGKLTPEEVERERSTPGMQEDYFDTSGNPISPKEITSVEDFYRNHSTDTSLF